MGVLEFTLWIALAVVYGKTYIAPVQPMPPILDAVMFGAVWIVLFLWHFSMNYFGGKK